MIGLTHSDLVGIVEYNPETGIFTWRHRGHDICSCSRSREAWNGNFAGKQAGSIGANGYMYTTFFNKHKVLLHSLAWFYMKKIWPDKYIDHINGDRIDNRFNNLREATASQNAANAKIRTDNKSGHKNVFWNSQKQMWHVRLVAEKRPIHIGFFSDIDVAADAAKKARIKFHKDYARHA